MAVCQRRVRELAERLAWSPFFLYLGRLSGLPVALEGALKLKEISYIPTDAYAAGEMKHGPIALLSRDTPVVCVATEECVVPKLLSNLSEVRARGARVLAVASEGCKEIAEHAEHIVYVPRTDPLLQVVARRRAAATVRVSPRPGSRARRRSAAQPGQDRHRRVIPGVQKVVALGGGHGLAAVVRSLRGRPIDLTVVVTVADNGGSSGELRRRGTGPGLGDMRRSLVASSQDGIALARALERRLPVTGLGHHPVGNLILRSVIDAFGDLERGSEWLARQLGAHARVLPATSEPVSLLAEVVDGPPVVGESAVGATPLRITRLRFAPDNPRVPDTAIGALEAADWVVMAPGSLYTSVIATCAVPNLAAAIGDTPAHVMWVSNLVRDGGETATLSAIEHLEALRCHGVRVDLVLFDPRAELTFKPSDIASVRATFVGRSIQGVQHGQHDSFLLGRALAELLGQHGDQPARASGIA